MGNKAGDSSVIATYLEINQRYDSPVPDGENPFVPPASGGAYLRSDRL